MEDKIQKYWDNLSILGRQSLLVRCGWRTAKGRPSQIAKKAMYKHWNELTPAMQEVLKRIQVPIFPL